MEVEIVKEVHPKVDKCARVGFPFSMVFSRLRSLVYPGLLYLLLATGTLVAGPGPTFRVALGPDPGALDWPALDDRKVLPLRLALAGSLVEFSPVSGFPRPGLAASWVSSEGGRTWLFNLRDSQWSDGSPLSAQDVADSWLSTARAAPADPLGNVLVSAGATDPRHFKAVFRNPVPSAAVFTASRYVVLPTSGDDSRGCGPFIQGPRKAGQYLAALRNPRYWDSPSVRIEKVVFAFTDSAETAELLYRRGEVDWVPHGGGPGTSVDQGLRDAVVSPGWGSTFLRFNLTLKPGDDRALRRTLSDVLDRARIVSETRGALSVPSRTLIPPPSVPSGDPVKAKTVPLVGFPEITILHAAGETNRRIAQEVAAQWTEKLGLTVGLKEMSYSIYLDTRKRGLYQVALAGWLGDYPDPLTFLEAFRSDNPSSDTGWSDPKYDALVDKVRLLPLGRARDQAVGDAETLLLGAQPLVPLVNQADVNQINLKRWQGWYPNPVDAHPWAGIGPRK